MKPTTIRASEIGAYLYCRRSWWYRRQGHESTNLQALARGSQAHNRHGRDQRRLIWLRGLASGLIALAALLLLLQL